MQFIAQTSQKAAPAEPNWFGLAPGQLGVLVALGAILFVALRWRKVQIQKQQQQRGNEPPEPRTFAQPPSTGAMRAEVQAMLADIEETTRRAAAQIDNRCQKLEILIAEADRKLQQLDGQLQMPVRSAPPPPIEGATANDAHQPVYDMADRGMDARQIAQALGKQPGEIELMLALRKSAK